MIAEHAEAAPASSPALDPTARLARPMGRAPPHLAAFFPDRRLQPPGTPGIARLVLSPAAGPAGAHAYLHASAGLWQAPRFGRRHADVGLLCAAAQVARADPLTRVLDGAAAPAGPADGAIAELLRALRVGGAPGLADPGRGTLGQPAGAVVVLDPCQPGHGAAARAMLAAARTTAQGRPVLVAASPDAPPGARPVLDEAGVTMLSGRLAPWALIDLADRMHGLAGPGLASPTLALARIAGVAVQAHPGPAPWTAWSPATLLATLLAASRWADPFHMRPWTAAQALRQLGDWRVAEATNRRIVACVGVEWFKHRALSRALASHAGAPRILTRGSAGLRVARRHGGALAVWSAAMPAGLPARARQAGVPLVQIEDGFIRSAGLGVQLAPALSLVLDGRGMHFDPSGESDLEHILTHGVFDDALLARAAAFRARLVAAGVTKYNLLGTAALPIQPTDRRVVLVPGQVEDDAAWRRGGGAIASNLDLLRAVRAAEPSAHILFKPHPDVAMGLRRGAIPGAVAGSIADQVLGAVPIAALYPRVAAVHTLCSLAGFEALLRGTPVTTWGRPFYAGWGLTEDHDPPPRRGRALSVDALVAGALLLYPRCIDPQTGLPCPPEILLDRLAGMSMAKTPRTAPQARALVARISRRLAGWWSAR